MNKKFILALMLVSGMAFAQSSGSSPGSSDQQQPSTQQPSSQSTSPTSAGQNSLTGCLKGSDSGWVLVAEGQSTPVTGDSSTLGPHNGHQVQVKGSQAADGSFQVTDVVMIAETCAPQNDTSASSAAGAATGAAAGAAASNASYGGQTAQSSPNDVPNPPQSTTQPSSTAPDTTTPQSTGTTPSTSADQPAASQGAHQKLPQSASPLPLLGLLGLASLASGLIARKKK